MDADRTEMMPDSERHNWLLAKQIYKENEHKDNSHAKEVEQLALP